MTKKTNTPLTYKLKLKEGVVSICGLNSDERVPRMLDDVLVRYGFVGADHEDYGDYDDGIAPSGADSVENEIGYVAEIVPISTYVGAKDYSAKRLKMIYDVTLAGCYSVEGKDWYTAMSKAYKAWNKAGRIIDGRSLTAALDDTLARVNEERKG